MPSDPSSDRCVEEELLDAYRRCRREGSLDAAEYVLRAIEELANRRPAARSAVDRAYLEAAAGGAPRRSHRG